MHVQPIDIGCEPSPSVPAETLLADGFKTYLLFWAVSKEVGESGFLADHGVAVLDCQRCVACRFGYPNDEGMHEHPLWKSGIADSVSSVLEVRDSTWAREVEQQMQASASRIWGGRGIDSSWSRDLLLRHFILALKEKTFECLGSGLAVERYFPTFDQAIAFVIGRFKDH